MRLWRNWYTRSVEGAVGLSCGSSSLLSRTIKYMSNFNKKITINDENFSIRNKIEEWMSQMNSHVGNVQTDNLANLTTNTTVSIKHYGVAGGNDSLGEWKFVNCFPVALGEIALDWGSNDTVEEYTVDWAYDYWTHAGGAGSS